MRDLHLYNSGAKIHIWSIPFVSAFHAKQFVVNKICYTNCNLFRGL